MIIQLTGKVIKGDGYGKVLGFPTANLDRRQWSKLKPKIRYGVYAGFAEVLGEQYQAAIVLGPEDNKALPKIEAHLLNYSKNLYGKKLTITLAEFIRPFKSYKNEQQLIQAIKQDIKIIKQKLDD